MKRDIILFLLLGLFLLFGAVDVLGQNKSYITVRGSEYCLIEK